MGKSITKYVSINRSAYRGIVKLYVDGSLVSSTSESRGGISVNYNFLIGRSPGTNHHFNGSIDNVMIFNKPITAEEVTAIYNNQNKL